MKEQMPRILTDSISEVFSTMYFLVPEAEPRLAEEVADTDVKGWVRADLSASRDNEVLEISIWTSKAMSLALTANILSVEPEDVGARELIDSHQEMINMVVGSVLTRGDRASEWKLGLPRSCRLPGGKFKNLMDMAQETIIFSADEQPFLAGWSFKKQ